MTRKKKSKYKHVVINKKKYYFYTIDWMDITGDAGHATAEEFSKFECFDKEFVGFQHEFLRKCDQYYKNVPNTTDDEGTKKDQIV